MSDAPSLSVAARLELLRSVLRAGDELEYTVVNTGDLPIMLGAAYVLERLENGRWIVANPNALCRAWGRRLPPGEQHQLTTRLAASLPAGSYRLRKRLSVDRDPHRGYEWLAQRNVEPCEATARFAIEVA